MINNIQIAERYDSNIGLKCRKVVPAIHIIPKYHFYVYDLGQGDLDLRDFYGLS